MSLKDALEAAKLNTTRYDPEQFQLTRQPKGWEPYVQWEGDKITLTSEVMENREYEHEELLNEWGFDPQTHEIGTLRFSTWQIQRDGEVEWARAYKAEIRKVLNPTTLDVEALKDYVRRHAPSYKVGLPTGPDAFVVCLSDFQLGKGENGGTPKTLERLSLLQDLVADRISELRKIGRPLGQLYVFGLGDVVEGCTGNYAAQEFQCDLTRREQINLVTEVLISMLQAWAPAFKRVVVGCVGGNHGENRKNGKMFTRDGDNDDILVFENLARVMRDAPAYKHVSFVIPEDERNLVLDVAGVNVGITHGDLMSKGANPMVKAEAWWKGQIMGMQPMAAARLLIYAHYHHPATNAFGLRTAFQLPAMDNGSKWFRDIRGLDSPAGCMTMRVSDQLMNGWDDYAILSPDPVRIKLENEREVDQDTRDVDLFM